MFILHTLKVMLVVWLMYHANRVLQVILDPPTESSYEHYSSFRNPTITDSDRRDYEKSIKIKKEF